MPFGGATGELTAALQYWVQSFHVENAGIRDMLQDIAIEEFSHLEMVGKLIAQHTSELDQTSVHDAPLFKIKGGGPHFLGQLLDSGLYPGGWQRGSRSTREHFGGSRRPTDLRVADQGLRRRGYQETLHHLLTREITHANMFMKALDAMGKLDDPFFGNIPPDETVKLVFNLSQDEDVRGPWNEEPDFEYIADPQPEGGLPPPPINADDEGHDSRSGKPKKRRAGAAIPAA